MNNSEPWQIQWEIIDKMSGNRMDQHWFWAYEMIDGFMQLNLKPVPVETISMIKLA